MKEKIIACKLKFAHFVLDAENLFRKIHCLFFGEEICVSCGKSSGIIPICSSCQKNLIVNEEIERCKICGKILLSEIDFCTDCRNERILKNVDYVIPLIPYRIWKKNLLFEWKSEEKRTLSPFFAKLIFEKLKEIFKEEGENLPVVLVPPRPGKIKKKGWDQIDELGNFLKNLYGIKILKVLDRLTKYQQKKLTRKLRLEQIQKAYVIKKQNKIKKFYKSVPETVILLDDVLTTGSTLESCAEELKKANVKKVIALTLFIVD